MLRLLSAFLILSVNGHSQMSALIGEWKNDRELKHASIGFSVMRAGDSFPIAEYNSGTALVPASTLKVLTTSAALGLLGGSYRYATRLCYTGVLDKATGILNGDLIIEGSGDPSLQSEHFVKGPEKITDTWAAILRDKGIRAVTGAVIGNAGAYPRTVPDQWIWADIGNYFGAAPCALNFMDNKFSIKLSGGTYGKRATLLNMSPRYREDRMKVTVNVTAKGTKDEAYVYGDPFGWEKEIRGTIPEGRTTFVLEASLPDPALLCAEMLEASLRTKGVSCGQKARSEYLPLLGDAPVLHTHYSPPLSNLVLHTNQKSDNLYCESMLLTLGKGDMKAGIEAVTGYWKSRGLDEAQVYMADGSGLSRANTVTPAYLTSLLCKIYRDSAGYAAFEVSLPRAGRQGSMAGIGKGTVLENNLRAKTGYLTRVRAYCGYLKTKSGQELAFSIIFNNYNCTPAQAKARIEKWMLSLAAL